MADSLISLADTNFWASTFFPEAENSWNDQPVESNLLVFNKARFKRVGVPSPGNLGVLESRISIMKELL